MHDNTRTQDVFVWTTAFVFMQKWVNALEYSGTGVEMLLHGVPIRSYLRIE